MPISLSVDHSNKLIHAEAVGAITRGEIEQHLSEERRAGGIPYRELIDATRATAAFDAADARSLIDTVRVIAREINFGPTAVIVADDMTYGMLRMLEVLLEDVCDLRAFRNGERNAAERWVRAMQTRPRIESKRDVTSQPLRPIRRDDRWLHAPAFSPRSARSKSTRTASGHHSPPLTNAAAEARHLSRFTTSRRGQLLSPQRSASGTPVAI